MRGESELGHKTFVFFADSVKNNAFSSRHPLNTVPKQSSVGLGFFFLHLLLLLLFVAAAIFFSALNY